LQKIPYILVIGDREQEAGEVNLRLRDGTVVGSMAVEQFLARVREDTAGKQVIRPAP
jgi:threonyl-tRNA synthetase